MSHDPTTWRELAEADVRRAARLVIKIQDEIDPQFLIGTPEGDYWLGVTLPADGYECQAMLRRIATFMAWKQARAFTLATELYEPDCVWCACIAPNERQACIARIQRKPTPWTARNFGAVSALSYVRSSGCCRQRSILRSVSCYLEVPGR